jgi:adenylate cyclase
MSDAAQQDAAFREREASLLFADLRGFSAITAAYPAYVVLGVLSRCFGQLADLVLRHGGTVDKFLGDGMMAVFYGDDGGADHARRAAHCAVEMQIAVDELRERHRRDELPEVYLGIGISSGTVMTGVIGSEAYRAYTVVGEDVNLASRIEALSLRGQVLVTEATFSLCGDFVEAAEPAEVYVKGRPQAVRIREVLGIRPAEMRAERRVPRRDLRRSQRVPVALGLQYYTMDGKTVADGPLPGTVRDLGYHGLLAEVGSPFPVYTELKLVFELPFLAFRVTDLYARTLSVRERGGRYLCGLEFTSVSAEAEKRIRLFVQMQAQ